MQIDFSVLNEGTIAVVTPKTQEAKNWLIENVAINEETQWWGPGIVVEHRFLDDLLQGITNDGLTIK